MANMGKIVGTIAIIVLSTTAALGVGVLMERNWSQKPVSISTTARPALATTTSGLGEGAAKEPVKPTDSTVVASKTGKKYHFPWCSGAKRIASSSKIVFADAAAAKKAGFEPAANCKGLQ